MTYKEFIENVQKLQIAAMANNNVSKFDVTLRPSGTYIWIMIRKDRTDSSFFFDVVKNDASEEKMNKVIKEIEELINY